MPVVNFRIQSRKCKKLRPNVHYEPCASLFDVMRFILRYLVSSIWGQFVILIAQRHNVPTSYLKAKRPPSP